MDLLAFRQKLQDRLKTYRPALIILLVGILLMLLPGRGEQRIRGRQPPEIQQAESLDQSLSRTLSALDGAGRVQVLLTEAVGKQVVYQFDEERREGERQRKTVLLSNSQRGQEGLVCRVLAPVYQGAVVLCQGGGRPDIRLSIVRAVTSATGLTSDKVTVLKMK